MGYDYGEEFDDERSEDTEQFLTRLDHDDYMDAVLQGQYDGFIRYSFGILDDLGCWDFEISGEFAELSCRMSDN